MDYKKWQPLQPGDIVDIIAPSGGISRDIIPDVKDFIHELGLVPRLHDDLILTASELIEQGTDPFCAQTDEYRFHHLKTALLANDSKAVWAIRGGYGCSRLIPYLEDVPPPDTAKLFIGLSDITVLHIFLQQKWQWRTIHGKVLSQFCSGKRHEDSVTEMKNLIFGQQELRLEGLYPLNDQARNITSIDAVITGGNLCMVEASIGTSWQIDTKHKILFLEDVGERGYRIDRSLEHLKQAGILSEVKAVIFGSFTEGQEKDGKDLTPYALHRFANQIDIPVFKHDHLGHGQISHPLPLGSECQLQLNNNHPVLLCLSGSDLAKTGPEFIVKAQER